MLPEVYFSDTCGVDLFVVLDYEKNRLAEYGLREFFLKVF